MMKHARRQKPLVSPPRLAKTVQLTVDGVKLDLCAKLQTQLAMCVEAHGQCGTLAAAIAGNCGKMFTA